MEPNTTRRKQPLSDRTLKHDDNLQTHDKVLEHLPLVLPLSLTCPGGRS